VILSRFVSGTYQKEKRKKKRKKERKKERKIYILFSQGMHYTVALDPK
jgi:hypothetical protein